MSKPSPAATNQAENQPAWIDVSQDADAPVKTIASDAEPPAWWLYLRTALCVLAIVWITEWVTTRRMIAERPPLRIDAAATLAPPRADAKGLLTTADKATPTVSPIMVHIVGAVKKPGVYQVGPRARLRDAVRLAGGAQGAADLESVNLAEFLTDGQQYAIPLRNAKFQRAPNAEISSAQITRSTRVKNNAPAVAGKAKPRAPKSAPPTSPLDLNSATAIELDTLPDIGAVKAARIIEYRTQNGAFKSVEDLVEVEGIGEKTLGKLRPFVVVR